MKGRVLFFSLLQDLTGCAELEVTGAPATVGELLERDLYVRWPALREWDAALLLALDHAYVRRDAALREGFELALMPPVQGG
jgi:molybdopterin converting factor small subunit